MNIHATRVSVRPPGGSWVALPITNDAGRAITVGLDVSWSRSTPRAHPDPGAITMTLISPPGGVDETRLVYDAAIRVEVQIAAGRPWKQIAFGWVQSYTRTTRGDGRHTYSVTLMDVLGRANATKLGMLPRPQETRVARVNAINAASAAGSLVTPPTSGGAVLARDVDNINMLDLVRDTASFSGFASEALDGKIEYSFRIVGVDLVVIAATGALAGMWYDGILWSVPAAAVEDTARIMDRTATISQVTVTRGRAVAPSGSEQVTTTYKPAVGSFSSSALTITTDKIFLVSEDAAVQRWALAVIQESAAPALRQETARVLIDRLPVDVTEGLISIGSRDAAICQLVDSPADLPDVVVITAATARLRGRDLQLVDVTFAPGSVFGYRPLAIADLAGLSQPPTFAHVETPRPLAVSDLTAQSLTTYDQFF